MERGWKALPKKVIVLYVKNIHTLLFILEYFDTRIGRGNLGELTPKAKYFFRSIVNKYREGKVKSSPVRAMK